MNRVIQNTVNKIQVLMLTDSASVLRPENRKREDVMPAMINMVKAAKEMRK